MLKNMMYVFLCFFCTPGAGHKKLFSSGGGTSCHTNKNVFFQHFENVKTHAFLCFSVHQGLATNKSPWEGARHVTQGGGGRGGVTHGHLLLNTKGLFLKMPSSDSSAAAVCGGGEDGGGKGGRHDGGGGHDGGVGSSGGGGHDGGGGSGRRSSGQAADFYSNL